MKVIVTGGAGFIGSHVVERLIADDHEVSVVDDLSTGLAENIPTGVILNEINIVDRPKLQSVFARERPELICHLAGQIDVRRSVEFPDQDAMTNVIGSINVMEAAVATGAAKIIYANSGGAIYGDLDPELLPATEDVPIAPLSPYGASKYTVEQYLGVYSRTHDLAFTSLRLPNVYGPRQDPRGEAGVVAIFFKKMIADEPITVFGDGLSSRDYTHVSDVAEAFLKSAGLPGNNTVNIGTGVDTTVLDLVRYMSEIIGYERQPTFAPLRIGEVARISLDATRAAREIMWTPSYDLEAGLRNTADYYLSRAAQAD